MNAIDQGRYDNHLALDLAVLVVAFKPGRKMARRVRRPKKVPAGT